MQVYSYDKENNNNYIHALYYFCSSLVWLAKQTNRPLLSISMFVLTVFLLIVSCTYNNYKILPAKKYGILLYWLRISIKVIYFFLIMNLFSEYEQWKLLLLTLFIFLIVEFCFSYIYLKYKSALFDPFDESDIEKELLKRSEKFINRKK